MSVARRLRDWPDCGQLGDELGGECRLHPRAPSQAACQLGGIDLGHLLGLGRPARARPGGPLDDAANRHAPRGWSAPQNEC